MFEAIHCKEVLMSTRNERGGQQGQGGSDAQSDMQQGSQPQQGGGGQQGGQAEQFSPSGGQQGGTGGSQQGGTRQQGSQQDAGNRSRGQQGGEIAGRGSSSGGMPSLFGFGGRGGSPFDMLRRLDEDVDRLFQQIWGGGRSLMRGRGAAADVPAMWIPQVEIHQEGGKLHVCADLPGLRKEDVTLSLEGDQLILQGERQSSREEGQQGSGLYHSERSYGSFYRSIPLPEGVDPQSAQASFKDGVLDVAFEAPRLAQQQARKIEIRDEGSMQGSGSARADKG
jgi:HSP20 family protein